MKIVHICYNFQLGGISQFVKMIIDLNNKLPNTHDVLLIQGDKTEINIKNCCETYDLKYKEKGLLSSVINAFCILKKYDGIMIHAAHPAVIMPLFFLKKRLFFFQHGMTVSNGPLVKRLVKKVWYSLVPILLRGKVICSTSFAKEKLRKKGIFLPEGAVKIVPFGIRFPEKRIHRSFTSLKETICIGVAGRFVLQKRFHLVLKSFLNYQGEMQYVIKFAGEGPEEPHLKQLASEIKSPKVNVVFLGRVSNMASFYSSINLFIFPSQEESFGLVALESLVYGVPVAVFTDVGGALSLVIHKKNGFVLQSLHDLEQLWTYLGEDFEIIRKQSNFIDKMNLSKYHIEYTRNSLDRLVMGIP